jgi:glycerol 3-phosphatase-2
MAEAAPGATPLDGVDLVLADLDGVVYRGPDAIPFAIEALNDASRSHRVGYLTNNASRTDASVAEHLSSLGLTVAADDVVTSPQAATRVLAQLVPAGSTVLVVGGAGLVDEVEKAGFVVTRSALDAPAAVVQGFAPEVGWTQLAEAAFALHAPKGGSGIPWVATNTDWTIPQARGTAPGNGTLVSAVHTAVGRLPVVAGKPEATGSTPTSSARTARVCSLRSCSPASTRPSRCSPPSRRSAPPTSSTTCDSSRCPTLPQSRRRMAPPP